MVRRFRGTYPDLHVDLIEMTSVQQVTALKEGQIDVGFGRLHVDDSTIRREVLREEPLVAALPIGHPLLDRANPLQLAEIVAEPLIIYPSKPRPSYADHVLSAFTTRGLKPGLVREVRELQTALGLVAAAVGISLVPDAVQRLRRDDIVYRPLHDATIISPIVMFSRLRESSGEIETLLQLMRELYRQGDKISFGRNGKPNGA
jgi:DNA-binding transcriptional LysR family regulator